YPTLSDLNSDSLISPFGARRSHGTMGSVAAMISTEPDFRYIRASAGKGDTKSFFMSTLFTVLNGEQGVSFVGPYMGSPYAAMLLESLIAKGSDKIVVLGWCGAISESVKTGDIIVVESAVSDEGTSRNYIDSKEEFPSLLPSEGLTRDLVEELEKQELSFKKGKIWTTDAIYRETAKKIAFFREKGAVAVEMECSALFSVAKYRKKDVAALLVVSDEVSSLNWKPGFRNKRFKEARKRAANVIMEFCKY
ncbi:MAG: nucleoside phosphorylase, partial [Thermodesulfobacteriota bacterium]|nr:nucleoside phosphorylase [Thermodesulfobacteriota bacterium]